MRNNAYQQSTLASSPLKQETFRIPGITCGGCVRRVTGILEQLPVRLDSISVGQATLSYDVTRISRKEIVETIQNAGYQVR